MVSVAVVPTYEYECLKCPRVFEIRQRISEPPLSTCDRCGTPIRRLLAATPFILKGGGWHVTDYPSEARKKAATSESAATASAGSEAKSTTPSGTASPAQGGSTSSSGSGDGKGGARESDKSSSPS